MRKVKIIADSCADLNAEQLRKYGIDYVKMSVFYDGEEHPALTTWTNEEAHAFYERMRGGSRVTTAQVAIAEFEEVFGRYTEDGYDIVYIACSSRQSGSVNTGMLVAAGIMERCPECRICCVDSLNTSIGIGMLCMKAADLAAEGMGAEQIAEYINSIKNTVQEYATVHSLESLRRAGRVSASSAFFGNILGVKPILVADADGAQVAYKKVRGRQNSLKEIVALLKDSIPEDESRTVYIAHCDCSEAEISLLRDMVLSEIKCAKVEVGYIGPIVGGSVGPDAIGVWTFGNEVTFRAAK